MYVYSTPPLLDGRAADEWALETEVRRLVHLAYIYVCVCVCIYIYMLVCVYIYI